MKMNIYITLKDLFTAGDLIAIIVALISLIGVIVSSIMTNKTTKKISKSNEQLQDKWNQKNIDASLTSSARIDWIQNVRRTTAELISSYITLLNTYDKEDLVRIIGESRNKSELLILFFGPESKNCNSEIIKDREFLLKKEDNDHKNDIIVNFLRQQQIEFNQYYKDLAERKQEKIKADIEYWSKQRYINAEQGPEITYIDREGEEVHVNEPIINKEDEKKYQDALSVSQNEYAKIKKLESDLTFLCNIMRIYLKIEWNKAKKGK